MAKKSETIRTKTEKMVGPWKKFRRPDGIFWPPECRDLSIKIQIATADLNRRLKRKRMKEISGENDEKMNGEWDD